MSAIVVTLPCSCLSTSPSRSMKRAYRRYVRYFADDPRFAREGGLCINPEAGEIFYLSREEKRRVLEIAMEEAHGKLPIIAGTWALTTEETVANR